MEFIHNENYLINLLRNSMENMVLVNMISWPYRKNFPFSPEKIFYRVENEVSNIIDIEEATKIC